MRDYSPAIPLIDASRLPRPAATGVPRLAGLVLPSFGVVVFAVALAQVLFLSQGAQGLFRDSDTGWHVRNGETMLQTLAAPQVDAFSYTRGGTEWFAWEWLSDVMLGSAHRVAGLTGVALLAGFAIALTVWGAARFSLSLGGNLFLTALSTVLLLGTSSIHWLARPHVFSWLLSLIFLAIVEHERRRPTRAIYVLPLLACVWANVHGSFMLGPAILFIYALAEWVNRRFAVACLASLAATFINPYGWRLHDHVFSYLNNTYLMDHIAEFRSFSFHSAGSLYVELFFFFAVLGTIALVKQRAYGPALLALALLHISLYSARHIPTAAVLLLPLCVAAITREAEGWPQLRSMLDYSERLRAIDRKVWGLIPVAIVLLASVVSIGNVGFDPAVFPIRAVDFFEKHAADGRIFAKDQWGGYLIYRFAGKTKVFIDGRSDFYGQALLETYGQVMDVKPGWDQTLKQYNVRYVMVPSEHALASTLQLSPKWKRVYADSVAVIFEAAESQHAA